MRALRLDRQLRPRDSGNVLDPPRLDVHDRGRQSCARPARFVTRFRCQDCGQHRAASSDSTDSDERCPY